MAETAHAQLLAGERLHLQHGPIDLVLRGWGATPALAAAYAAARRRFEGLLDELVAELPQLRRPVSEKPVVQGPVARRMLAACQPHEGHFITPMAAVAGSVADEILAAMTQSAPLARAFVNDGGDIAIHLAPGESLRVGVAADFSGGAIPALDGAVLIAAGAGIGGIATSGWRGRSFSLGIADSVTVLAGNAAAADAAATLIANAVDGEAPGILRRPARELDPDSDLGERLVTVAVPPLDRATATSALARGLARAESFRARGLIAAAALMLGAETCFTTGFPRLSPETQP